MADKKTLKNIFNLVYLIWQKMFTQNHLNVQVFIVGVRVCSESLCIHLRPAGALSWPEKQVYRALGLPNAFHVQSFTHNNTSCQVRVCWLLPGSQTSRDWSENGRPRSIGLQQEEWGDREREGRRVKREALLRKRGTTVVLHPEHTCTSKLHQATRKTLTTSKETFYITEMNCADAMTSLECLWIKMKICRQESPHSDLIRVHCDIF